MLQMLLETEGYAVTVAVDALNALAVLLHSTPPDAETRSVRKQPDLVLLDLQLPVLSGDELIRRLERRNVPVPPVIVMSAKHTEDVVQAAATVGAANVLFKPFQLHDVLAQIDAALSCID